MTPFGVTPASAACALVVVVDEDGVCPLVLAANASASMKTIKSFLINYSSLLRETHSRVRLSCGKNRVEINIAATIKTSDQTNYYALAAAYVHKNGFRADSDGSLLVAA
jgi:hypothetical protein